MIKLNRVLDQSMVLEREGFRRGDDITLMYLNKTPEMLYVEHIGQIGTNISNDAVRFTPDVIHEIIEVNAARKHIKAIDGISFNHRMRADIWLDGTVFCMMPGELYSASKVLREYALKHSGIMDKDSIPLMSLIMTSDTISIFRDSDTYLPYSGITVLEVNRICLVFKEIYSYYLNKEPKTINENSDLICYEGNELYASVNIFNGLVPGCDNSYWPPRKYLGSAKVFIKYIV